MRSFEAKILLNNTHYTNHESHFVSLSGQELYSL